jgi:hypothetical protein
MELVSWFLREAFEIDNWKIHNSAKNIMAKNENQLFMQKIDKALVVTQ